jgi:hypothetical protein
MRNFGQQNFMNRASAIFRMFSPVAPVKTTGDIQYLVEYLREDYRSNDMPYGDTPDGLLRWIEEQLTQIYRLQHPSPSDDVGRA